MRPTFILTFLFFIGKLSAQSTYMNLDTIYKYDFNLGHTVNNGDTVYCSADGNKISLQEFRKYSRFSDSFRKCKPCYLIVLGANDKVIREGVQYTDCAVGKRIEYYPNGNIKRIGYFKENTTGSWNDIFDRGFCFVYEGRWIFMDEKGDTLYSEFWENGKFIDQVPEQSEAEIWDVSLVTDSIEYNGQLLTNDQFLWIDFIPRFKNSNTRVDLFLECTFRYKSNSKDLRVDVGHFRKIDINEIENELNVPKGEVYECDVFIYADRKFVKWKNIQLQNQ